MIIVVVERVQEEQKKCHRERECSVPYIEYNKLIKTKGKADRLINYKRICIAEILHLASIGAKINWNEKDLQKIGRMYFLTVPVRRDEGEHELVKLVFNEVLEEEQRRYIYRYLERVRQSEALV